MDPHHAPPDIAPSPPTEEDRPHRAWAEAVAGGRRVLAARTAGQPAWVVLIEVFIGLGWLRAATEKLIDPAWWQGLVLTEFLAEHQTVALWWYRPFLDWVVAPRAVVTAAVVLTVQLVAGTCLVSGRRHATGLAMGMALNFSFLAAGAVNPSAFYLLSQGAVALWLVERASGTTRVRTLFGVRAAAVAIAAASVPFVRTIDPAMVIDDPAAMFVAGGLVTAVAADGALRSTGAATHAAAREAGQPADPAGS